MKFILASILLIASFFLLRDSTNSVAAQANLPPPPNGVPGGNGGAGMGQPCSTQTPCQTGLICDTNNLVCVGGNGTTCTNNSQCGYSLTCSANGTCVPSNSNSPGSSTCNPTKKLPGIEFLPINECTKPGDLISAIYVFALSLIGVSAFAMLTFGGIKYMLSGDRDPTQAKEMMKNALIGLVIAFTAYLILYTINPDLVSFSAKFLELTPIKVTMPATNSPPGLDDNCNDTTPCTSGLICDAEQQICKINQGGTCQSDSDCVGDLECPTTTNKCSLPEVAQGGACTSTTRCTGALTCLTNFTNPSLCRLSNGNEDGVCQALCPDKPAAVQLGGICTTPSDCDIGLGCRQLLLNTSNVQTQCSTATGGANGRCLPTNCKANGQNTCFGNDNCTPSGTSCVSGKCTP